MNHIDSVSVGPALNYPGECKDGKVPRSSICIYFDVYDSGIVTWVDATEPITVKKVIFVLARLAPAASCYKNMK